MAKFIKDYHDLLEFLAGKNVATKYVPEKVDLALYETSLSLFTAYHDHYVKTEKIARFLMPFLRKKEQTVTAGIAPIPGDYQHTRRLTLHDGTKVDQIEDAFWDRRAHRKLAGPSMARPIARIEDLGGEQPERAFEVLPVTIDKLVVYYFKTPNKPKYAYSTVGTKYVYDDAGSTDIEWSPLAFPELMMKTLSKLGINLREAQVIQYAELIKNQEGSK